MMNKNRQFKWVLFTLLIIMGILSFKLIFVAYKFNYLKNQALVNIKVDKNPVMVEKYGYSDILELIGRNSDFGVKTINMIGQEKCNVQVDYRGDIKLLNTSLYSLNESKSLLSINSININKESKTTTISIDFKKNK
ncbi:hypothetical protein G9F71_016615 [Clostridium sp. FP2]|uniref:hypothetical protein n=1 Tax=Clostridium sp. FP2 TaxID=2724481 RepID=UPI0013E9604B|nr:hypothetical protein [Clostridium sp. FP2]MBZ9624475.1 hypothetical protein [Clostridium sp. FP2]